MEQIALAAPDEVRVLDVPQVVELEQRIAAEGTSLATLMSRAGRAIAQAVEERFPAAGRATVLAGAGNNGGDGWVAAELLAAHGWQVTLATPKAAADISAHPAREAAAEATERAGAGLTVLVNPEPAALEGALAESAVVIDALLGTGFDAAEVREPLAGWIGLHNSVKERAGFATVAADVPSGLSAQRGTAARACIVADETITMLVAKPGLLAPAAAPYTGRVRVALIDRA